MGAKRKASTGGRTPGPIAEIGDTASPVPGAPACRPPGGPCGPDYFPCVAELEKLRSQSVLVVPTQQGKHMSQDCVKLEFPTGDERSRNEVALRLFS